MDHNKIYELLSAYALGCLDDDEASIVSDHLASCVKCNVRLKAHQRTVDYLSFGAPQVNPPDALKKRLMNKIQAKGLINDKIQRPPKRQTWKNFWQKFSPVWAVASLAIIAGLAVSNLVQLNTSRKPSGEEIVQEMLILKMQGTTKAPNADGTLVIGPNRLRGVLVASDLPVPDKDYHYQLWLLENGKRMNGGVFSVTPNGYAVVEVASPVSLSDFQSFAVTLEPAGGSPIPTGDQFMVGYL